VRTSSTLAPGLRLVLLAILLVMALTADTRIASAAPGGAIGTAAWRSLLNFDPVRPRWAGRRAKREGGATASRALPPRRPLSASLPAKANEIDPGPAP
jgi:hypothetical protein